MSEGPVEDLRCLVAEVLYRASQGEELLEALPGYNSVFAKHFHDLQAQWAADKKAVQAAIEEVRESFDFSDGVVDDLLLQLEIM